MYMDIYAPLDGSLSHICKCTQMHTRCICTDTYLYNLWLGICKRNIFLSWQKIITSYFLYYLISSHTYPHSVPLSRRMRWVWVLFLWYMCCFDWSRLGLMFHVHTFILNISISIDIGISLCIWIRIIHLKKTTWFQKCCLQNLILSDWRERWSLDPRSQNLSLIENYLE